MNTLASIPDAVRITMETFERLIRLDERRQRELLAEISALELRARVIGASGDAGWIGERFIQPRVAELRAVETRLAMIREKLHGLQEEWSKPQASPEPAWVESGSTSIVALAA